MDIMTTKQEDSYQAENYKLTYKWVDSAVEITKEWNSSGYISVTKLTPSETYALLSFIENNIANEGGATGIDDWVDLV